MTLDPIRPYADLLKLAAIAVAVVAAVWYWNAFLDEQQAIGYRRAAGEYAVKLATEREQSRVKEQGWFLKWERENNARTETETRLVAADAAAAAAVGRVQRTADDLRRRLATAPVEACRQTADACLAVFGECATGYRALGRAAAGHAADAETCLAAWPD